MPIFIVSALLILFASLYFIGINRQKKLKASIKDLYNYDITDGLAEQLRIINAQLDLMFELSGAFIICCDYARDSFYMSENGRRQLGCTDQAGFEGLIHEDYMPLYEEVTNIENIRKHEIAESLYTIKIKGGEYLMKVKPIYDEDGINKALIAAFIKNKNGGDQT